MYEDDEDEEGARSFAHTVMMIADGDLNVDASEELQALMRRLRTEAQRRHGEASGTFTLKLALTVEANGMVAIKPRVETKAAHRQLAKGTLWLTRDANLTAQNPRQQRLALREVDTERGPARDVGNEGHEAREV